MSEMLEILSTLHDMEGVPKDHVEKVAKTMFAKMEIDEEEEMTLEQFTNGCLINEDVIYLLTDISINMINDLVYFCLLLIAKCKKLQKFINHSQTIRKLKPKKSP